MENQPKLDEPQIDTELIKFTKEKLPEERSEVAAEILHERKNRFEAINQTKQQIKEIENLLENKETTIEELENKLATLQRENEEYNNKTYTKILSFLSFNTKQKELEQELGMVSKNLEKGRQECVELAYVCSELKSKLETTSEIDNTRVLVKKFYEKHKDTMTAWEKSEHERKEREAKMRDVSDVIDRHNCFIVHGYNGIPEETKTGTVLTSGVGAKQLLEVDTAFQPVISCSSIRDDQSENQTVNSSIFSLIVGGHISLANPDDASTVPNTINTREPKFGYQLGQYEASNEEQVVTRMDDPKAVDIAIKYGAGKHSFRSYNELVIDQPIIGGLMIKHDWLNNKTDIQARLEYVLSLKEKANYPIFVMKEGKLTELIITESNSSGSTEYIHSYGKEISPKELKSLAPNIDNETKQKVAEGIYENSPFQFKNTEYKTVETFTEAEQLYVKQLLLDSNNIIKIKKALSDYNPLDDDSAAIQYKINSNESSDFNERTNPQLFELKGSVVFPLANLITKEGQVEYFVAEKDSSLILYKRTNYLSPGKGFDGKYSASSLVISQFIDGIGKGILSDKISIWSGINSMRDLEIEVDDTPEKYVEKIRKNLQKTSEDSRSKTLQEVANHLAGFSKMSADFGRQEDAKLYRDQISILCQQDPEKIDEIIEYRLGKHGGYRTNENEVRSFGKIER